MLLDGGQEKLCSEYRSWCSAQGLPQMSADELLHEDLTDAQRSYVSGFIQKWSWAVGAEKENYRDLAIGD